MNFFNIKSTIYSTNSSVKKIFTKYNGVVKFDKINYIFE